MLSCWLIFGETEGVESFGAGLDDESRRVIVELVGVRPDPAVFGFLENEGEGIVEFLMRAEPDELAGASGDVGAEGPLMRLAGGGIQPRLRQ